MSEVYRARDVRLGRDVALKVLPDRFGLDTRRLARFDREAKTLASLNHPNIATLHDVEESNGLKILVMELVEGETLADLIALGHESGSGTVRKGLSVGLAVEIAKQVALALEAAHEHGVVHRDLKPANIKVRRDGTVKVLDFGLAKSVESTEQDAGAPAATITMADRAGALLGTPAYMSPEQARGQATDRRTDIWAFGCVLYEMLSGRRAFDGATTSDVIARVLEREPDWSALPEAVPGPVRRLLARCLEKDGRRRLRDIADARGDLDAAGEPAKPGAAPEGSAAATRLRRWRLAGAAAVLMALGTLPWALRLRPAADPQIQQFVLLPPDGTAFGGGVIDRTPALAVSPDGRSLAFVASTPAGNRALWVRPLVSLNARRLAGTDGASEPFWSPDGSSIAFFADGKLKRVGVAGEAPPVTLADARNGSGGTWSRQGVIVFAPSTQDGLLRISEAGGAPTPVTRPGASGDYGHVYPQFLPDGRHFLYLVRAVPSRKGIYIGSIDSTDGGRVLVAREKARFAPPGHLLFLREGRLMAQAFNTTTLAVSGDPVPVASSVAFIATDGRASFDISATGMLVYRAGGLLASSQPVWVDRTGRTVGTVGEPGDYQTARLSPDGARMIVEKHDLRTGTGDLWLIDLTLGSTSRVTSDGMHNTAAVWSPNGERLVYTARPDGIRNLHLKTIGSESDERLLTPGPDRIPTDWSEDGRYILFTEGPEPRGPRDLWALRMPDRTRVPFLRTEFDERGGQFSPTGRWVAYVSNETGRDQVFVRSFPDATAKRQISANGGRAPRWSRNERELFFVGLDGALMAASVRATTTFNVSTPQLLFTADMRGSENAGGNTADAWFAVDRRRFFIVPPPPQGLSPAPPITVVVDWRSLLRNDAP